VALPNQVHDDNPHIAPNGVFWTVPVSPDGLQVDPRDRSLALHATVPVFDDHDLLSTLRGSGPAVPATVSFAVRWSGANQVRDLRNPGQGFAGVFLADTATIQWSVKQEGFAFDSAPARTSASVFAVLGVERNGVFFS
jgi:hypothetical protein